MNHCKETMESGTADVEIPKEKAYVVLLAHCRLEEVQNKRYNVH